MIFTVRVAITDGAPANTNSVTGSLTTLLNDLAADNPSISFSPVVRFGKLLLQKRKCLT